jgi:hypothetical protein
VLIEHYILVGGCVCWLLFLEGGTIPLPSECLVFKLHGEVLHLEDRRINEVVLYVGEPTHRLNLQLRSPEGLVTNSSVVTPGALPRVLLW